MRTANIVGSGPNGLAAAITLARAGVAVSVYERNPAPGGACATAELTLPGFHHDLGASAFPMGAASPFFRSLPLAQFGLRWIRPVYALAHPFDDGSAVSLTEHLADMQKQVRPHDFKAWKRLFGSVVEHWEELVPEILGPVIHVPRHPLTLARFGLPALLPATTLAKSFFEDERARGVFAGCAAHSVMPLDSPLSAAVGIVLVASAHTVGWPVPAGGAGALTQALVAYFESLGGVIYLDQQVEKMEDMPTADAVFFDTGVGALERIASDRLSAGYRSSLRGFVQGPGAFKVDWALSGPIPWLAAQCRDAGTIHVGGTIEEITDAEAEVFAGTHAECPFVLLVQPSVADRSRAPRGQHTAWAYCHVPNGSTVDRTEAIEAQVERFAPGFRDVILARRTQSTAELESWNPNLVGGDLSGGAMTARQMVLRPSVREYGTSDPQIYLCSSSTPPGGGVHGMCGYHAAMSALRRLS